MTKNEFIERLRTATLEPVDWLSGRQDSSDIRVRLKRIFEQELEALWERGDLKGAKAEDAYFVKCDETTCGPEDIGIDVGGALLSPKIFEVFRYSIKLEGGKLPKMAKTSG